KRGRPLGSTKAAMAERRARSPSHAKRSRTDGSASGMASPSAGMLSPGSRSPRIPTLQSLLSASQPQLPHSMSGRHTTSPYARNYAKPEPSDEQGQRSDHAAELG